MPPRSRSLWLAMAILAATSRTAGAGPAPAGDALEPARKALVGKLESLATWCDGNRLPGERDRTFRRILVLDPDHARSRAALRFKRADKKSAWEQAYDYAEPPDWSKGLLGEARKRRVDAARAFREAAGRALDAAGASADDGRREETVELSLDLAPEDGEFRKARGDVEVDGVWLLAETVEGRRRRTEFAAFLRDVDLGAIREDKQALANHWDGGAISEHFKTYGEVTTQECIEEVRTREMGHRFLEAQFGTFLLPSAEERILLFPDYKTARSWLTGSPYAALLKESELFGGMSLRQGLYASWQSRDHRSVSGLRNLLSRRVAGAFRCELRPWVVEGPCQRMCRLIARRHGASFAALDGTDRPDDEEEDDTGAGLASTSDWLAFSADVLRRDPARRMRAIFTMNLNAMRRGDVLTAYALGAYLLEGRPERLEPLVVASAQSDDADKACRKALGVDAGVLAWRVRRWVLEAGAK